MSEDKEKLIEALRLFCEALENAVQVLRKELAMPQRKSKGSVKEEIFNVLKWDLATGEKLGEFEVSYKANNDSEQWVRAYDVLRKSDATIKDRYHGPKYVYGYWLYGEDKIYRKKLQEKKTQ